MAVAKKKEVKKEEKKVEVKAEAKKEEKKLAKANEELFKVGQEFEIAKEKFLVKKFNGLTVTLERKEYK